MHKFVSVTICWSETTGISQVMAQHNELGRRGEEEAVNYLKSKITGSSVATGDFTVMRLMLLRKMKSSLSLWR